MEEIRNSRGTLSHNRSPLPPAAPPVKDTRSSLMDEIRNARGGFNTLRHVSDEKKVRPSILEDPRNQLLDQIRTGVTLKKVDLDSVSGGHGGGGGGGGSDNSSSAEPTGMAGMLQRALQERTTALNFSSSDNEEDEEDEYDEEWD